MNTALSHYEKTKEKDLTALALLMLGLEELKQTDKRIKGITKEEWKEVVYEKSVQSEKDREIPQGWKRSYFQALIERLTDGGKLEELGLVKEKKAGRGTVFGLTESGWSLIAKEYAVPSQPRPIPIHIPYMPKLNISELAPVVTEDMVANFALLLISQYNYTHKQAMDTTTLKKVLLADVVVNPESAEQLANRKDTKITQIIRNLKSHNRLKKMGWVSQSEDGYNVLKAGLVQVGKTFTQNLLEEILKSEMRFSKPQEKAEVELGVENDVEMVKVKQKSSSKKLKI